uniref:carbonic anhydrase n=1 Tax=Globisporangium ultimum (strain ATCC 200006 / CBS 805.95 / DAOM BR144) TaxID=431595 RepID=K3WH45_GLOUD
MHCERSFGDSAPLTPNGEADDLIAFNAHSILVITAPPDPSPLPSPLSNYHRNSLSNASVKYCTTSPKHYHEICHSHDATSIQYLFDNKKKWREKKQKNDAEFFQRTAEKQTPRYLWIGCSDSRVPAEEITGLTPGEMFVHRNAANLVVSNDISSLSVIQFAVEKLKVKDIIICGHYGLCRLHQSELLKIPNERQRFHRTVELNIVEQCLNVFKVNMAQRNQQKYGFPRIHGLVYDIHSGVLKQLDIDYQGYLKQYNGIYRLHAFHTDEFPPTIQQMRCNMIQSFAEEHQEDDDGTISVRYISRVLTSESDLFSPEEVDLSIDFARSEMGDPATPFIKIESLIEFFAPRTTPDDAESSTE